MKVEALLLEQPTQPHRVTGRPHHFERFESPPEVRRGSPVRLRAHDTRPVGTIIQAWVDTFTGSLLAEIEIDVEHEAEARAALSRSKAASIEVEGLHGRTRRSVLTYDQPGTVVGIAIGVPVAVRSDTRVTHVGQPAPKRAPAPAGTRATGGPRVPAGAMEFSAPNNGRLLRLDREAPTGSAPRPDAMEYS